MGQILMAICRSTSIGEASRFIAAVLMLGILLSWESSHPRHAAAAVEIAPGAVAETDQKVMQELVAAFDEAEVAVQQADLDALMLFYANGYNYHGLKRPDVRRVWEEVFSHYGRSCRSTYSLNSRWSRPARSRKLM